MRLAVLCDLAEEDWPSMDVVADMLIEQAGALPGTEVLRVQPVLPRSVASLIRRGRERPAERRPAQVALGIARYLTYPAALRRIPSADWYHVADHSYAHLALGLPARRTGVFCHDVDAFRALDHSAPPRSLRRLIARGLLAGLRRARVVFHSTPSVREEILERRLVPAERLVHAPYGIAREFTIEPSDDDRALGDLPPYVLHVGSLIPRKNPRFLLRLFASLSRQHPELWLVQVSGGWGPSELAELEALGIAGRVRRLRDQSRAQLAALYRQAKALLLPSTAEGFGLPVVEALASGTPVVASDLPVLRQVGQNAVVYCPVNNEAAWLQALEAVLAGNAPALAERLAVAGRYSWARHAETIVSSYRALD